MIESIDPRAAAIADRLAGVVRVVGVTGSKGGIGKSVVASLLALALADRGHTVGLFDLDFTSPTDHVVLGSSAGFPVETFGIDPHLVHGIEVMSVAFLTGAAPTPMRGVDATNALLELLAITRWGSLDMLILDMPPGLGDTTLDVIRYVPRVEHLLVASGARLVIDSVRRAIGMLTELSVSVLGMVENLSRPDQDTVERLAAQFEVPFLGSVPMCADLEAALGDADALRRTAVYEAMRSIGDDVMRSGGRTE